MIRGNLAVRRPSWRGWLECRYPKGKERRKRDEGSPAGDAVHDARGDAGGEDQTDAPPQCKGADKHCHYSTFDGFFALSVRTIRQFDASVIYR